VSESLPSNDPGVQKRRSTRIAQSVPITVSGTDALGQAFKERTSTVSVNCHGCKYQSKHYVPKTALVTIEIARAESDAPPRTVEGRVAWVQRPRTVRELFQIGVEFTVPGNVWGIAFPPADWFPLPDEPAEQAIEIPVAPAAEAPAKKKEEIAAAPVAPAETKKPAASVPEKTPTSVPASESKVRVLPTPASTSHAAPSAHESMSAARQMARLLAEAKQHLRRSMQTGAAEAVAQEVRTAREQVEQQLKTVVSEAVEGSVTQAAEKSVQAAVQSAVQSAVENSLQQLVERATQQVVQNALAAFEQAREAAAPKAEELDSKVRAAVERVVEDSAAKLAEQTIQESVHQTVEQAVKQSVQQAVERATANLPVTQTAATAVPNEEALRQLDEAAHERLANWRKEIEDAAGELQEKSLQRLSAESETATQKWRTEFDAALEGASEQMSAQLNQISQAATARAEEEIAARKASLQSLMNDAAAEAQKNLEALCAGLDEQQARAESAAGKADEAARRAEETSAQIEAMSRAAYDDAQRKLNDLLASQAGELDRRAEELLQKKASQLEKPIQEIADEKMRQLAEQVEEQLAPHYQRAQEAEEKLAAAGEQLAAAGKQAEDVLEAFRLQMRDVSEEALATALERMRQQTAELPADFEEKCRAALTKVEEELDAKTTETSHTTFEALYKASEWYQKKAQTNMQSALEKMMEQSTGTMRDHAAELSRMFASELDHCSRSYVEHAQGLIEESAKDVKEKTREQLTIAAQTTAASAIDELGRIARESLAQFEEIANTSTERARTSVSQKSEEAMAEFNALLEQRLADSAAEVRRSLQEQLQPLVDEFHTKRDAEQDAWLERMKGTVEQSIEQYKERLENASNSWLLASATTLGQHSKGVLETLSHAAEERLRDTCADVFANLGETLRQRMLGISSDVGTDKKSSDNKPTEKK
jgi:hypothetical protein